MPSVDRPLHLFMSSMAAGRFGERIASVLNDRPHALCTPGTSESRFDIIFVTRDVVADSANGTSPTLAHFINVARRCTELKWLHVSSAGADRPYLHELVARGVMVTNSTGATAPAVGLTAFGGLIALARKFDVMAESAKRHAWEPILGDRAPDEVHGQTVVIVGMGPIGQEIARLCKVIDMRVIGVRRSAGPCPPADRTVTYAELPSVLPEARWLILACPISDLTRRLIDAKALALMPRGSHMVNVGRGGVVVDRDLQAALASGHIASAFLDVFEEEPLPPDSPFWTMPNVIVTPHSASHTTGAYDRVGDIFLDNLARWRDGRPLRNALGAPRGVGLAPLTGLSDPKR